MNDMDSGLLKCEQPPELRGLVFLDLDPHAFCSAPLILKLAIQDIQPFSVLVSWQSRNHSGIRGYQVAYHSLEDIEEVIIKLNLSEPKSCATIHAIFPTLSKFQIRARVLEPNSRSTKLSKLSPNTRYRICVLGLGNWVSQHLEDDTVEQFNFSKDRKSVV